MTMGRKLVVMLVVATTVTSSAMATDLSVRHTRLRSPEFDPILDADILSLGGAPGTATLVSDVPFDPILDADILALGGKPGSSTYVEGMALDPILDADLLGLRRD
jgi:hypothetical protein